jgi:hypothetical protein
LDSSNPSLRRYYSVFKVNDMFRIFKKCPVAIFIAMAVLSLTVTAFPRADSERDSDSLSQQEVPDEDRLQSSRYTGYYPGSKSNHVFEITGNFLPAGDNEKLELYVDVRSLAIRLRNKLTGYIWSSDIDNIENERLNVKWKEYFLSGIIIEYYDQESKRFDPKTIQESVLTNPGTNVDVMRTGNGFSATVTFGESKISLSYSVTLTQDGIDIALDSDNIIEPDKFKLISVTFYPLLGGTKSKIQDGYFFIPDGDGALVNFKNYYTNLNVNYAKKYYGDDQGIAPKARHESFLKEEQKIMFSVYGIIHGVNDNGLMVLIRKGTEHAELVMYPAGIRTDFYFINNKFYYRQPYTHRITSNKYATVITPDRSDFDILQSVILLTSDDASYTGIGKKYREYLIGKGDLQLPEAYPESIPLRLEILASATEEGIFTNKNITMTMLAETGEIVSDLNRNGVRNIHVNYLNATKDTLTYRSGDRLRLREQLGSLAEMADLADRLRLDGNVLYMGQDYGAALGKVRKMSTYEEVIRLYNKEYLIKSWKFGAMSSYRYYFNAKGFARTLEDESRALREAGITNLAVVLPYVSSSFNEQVTTREQTIQIVRQALLDNKRRGGHMLVEAENFVPDYAAAVDGISGLKMSATLYPYITDTVPFTSIVYSGRLNLFTDGLNNSGNPDEVLLKMIEWNVYPSFIVTKEPSSLLMYSDMYNVVSSQYDMWKDEIIETYRKVASALDNVIGATIESHETLAPGVVLVRYSNNVSIAVNYSSVPYHGKGIYIDAMDSEVIVVE